MEQEQLYGRVSLRQICRAIHLYGCKAIAKASYVYPYDGKYQTLSTSYHTVFRRNALHAISPYAIGMCVCVCVYVCRVGGPQENGLS